MSQVPTADPLDFLWQRKGIPASGMTPRQFQSPQETMRQKLAAQEEDPGFFGGVKLAFNTGLTRTLAGYIATAPGKEDPNWELTPEAMTRFGEGLPNEWLDEFAGAVSEDHAIRIRANLLDLQETYRKLSLVRGNLPGWLPFVGDAKVSSALVFGAQVLDPATLLATAATNGAVNGFTAGGATAAGRVIRSGVANAGVNAALTAAEAGMSNPDVQVEDVLMAAGIGFGLGGAARGLSEHGLSRAAAERVVRDSEFEKIVRALDESGQPTTAEHITEVLGASAKRYTQQLKEWSYTPMERAAAVIDEHMPDEVKAAIRGEVENPPTTTNDALSLQGATRYEQENPQGRLRQRFIASDSTAGADFFQGISEARATQRFGAAVEVKQPEFYSDPGVKLFLAPDKSAGAAVTPEGDLVSVFKKPGSKADINEILAEASANAKTLDAFEIDGFLPTLYGNHGFRPAGRMRFNREFAPPNWNYELAGEPDFVLMVRDTSGRSGLPEIPSKANGGYAAIKDQVPVFTDYDSAVAAQRAAVARVEGASDASLSAAMGAAGTGESLPEVPAGSPPEPPNKLATDFSAQRIADGAWVPPTAMSAVRGIMGELSNWLGKSPSNEVRRLALAAVDDTLPRGTRDNPVPTMFSANAWVHEQRIVAPRQAHANADASFHAWLDETGQRWKHNRGELHEHFMEEVGKAQQQPPGVYTTNKHINKAADGYRKLLMDMRDVAERHGVKGFDKFKSDPTWFPHWYSKPKIDAVAAKYGTQGIERVFRAALVSDSPDMDPKLINKIAKWMTRRIDLIGEHDELKNAMLFHSDAGDLLAKTLKEEVAGITDSEIESVVFGVQPRNKESGLVPNAKRRLRLDANVVVKLDDLNGNPGELRYTDLITTNAQQVADRYTSNIAGASAMAELYRVMKTSPDQVIETRQHLLDIALKDVRKEAENMGLSGQAVENLVRETEVKLDAVLRVIEGTPLTGNPRMAKIGQYVRDFNTMRLGGGFGIAQLADLGAGIAEAGFLPMMRHMPVLRQIRETIFGGGEMGARTRNELSRYLTMGDNGIHGDALGRFDATGDVVMDATDRAGRFFRRGAKLTGTISGMKALNRGIGHAAEAGIMETWAHYISTGRLPSKIRLAAMTLDEDMAKRIIAEGKKHSTISSNLFGHKFTELNIEKWDRQVAREFLNAVRQTSNRIAQRNDIGAQALWMSTWWGKILTQYKTFPINALQKQLLFNFHMRDMTAAYNTFWGLTMGAVTYYAYTEVAALGRPDREKYLDERLSPRNLAFGAFQRSNISSVIPMFVDSAMWAGNYKPLFTARTSGLPSDLITGNPTFDLGNTAIAAFMRPVHAGSSSAYDLSQEDIAVMRRLFPWQNIWGVKQMIDALSRDLPPRSQQQQN